MKRLLVFVCIANRNRSPFAEFFFSKLIRERDKNLANKIRLMSCGFVPRRIKEQLAALQIDFPDPFFGRPLALSTMEVLRQEGITVPNGWVTRPLTAKLVKEADTIIVVRPEQKMELIERYPEKMGKIFTIREISQWDRPLSWEEPAFLKRALHDISFWDYVEENMDNVSIILAEMKEMLLMAYSNILDKIGLNHSERSHE